MQMLVAQYPLKGLFVVANIWSSNDVRNSGQTHNLVSLILFLDLFRLQSSFVCLNTLEQIQRLYVIACNDEFMIVSTDFRRGSHVHFEGTTNHVFTWRG
jgi:hypothetical protein